MLRIIKLGFPLLLLLLPVLSYADSSGIFKPADRDLSYFILEVFYGHVDGILHGENAVLAKMFAVFNSVALIFASIVVVYILVISTVNTANEGEMLGKKWSSMWVPIKLVVGIILLIPKASGYSIIQVIVMWIVVMGIGIADSTWKAMVTHYGQGGNLISAPASAAPPSNDNIKVVNLAGNVLKASTCVMALQQELQKRSDKFKQLQQDSRYRSFNLLDTVSSQLQNPTKSNDGKYVVYFPNAVDGMPELQGVCGSLKWNAVNTSNFCDYYSGGEKVGCERYLKENPNALSQLQAGSIEQVIPVALQSLVSSLQSTAWSLTTSAERLIHPERFDGGPPFLVIQPQLIWNRAIALNTGSPLVLATNTFNSVIMPKIRDYTVTFNVAQNAIGPTIQKLIIDQGWMIAGSFANSLLIKHNAVERINLLGRVLPEYQSVQYSQFPSLDEQVSRDIYALSFGSPLSIYVSKAFDVSTDTGPITRLLVRSVDERFLSPVMKEYQSFKQGGILGFFTSQIVKQEWLDQASSKILDITSELGNGLDKIVAALTAILSPNGANKVIGDIGSTITSGMVNFHVLTILTYIGQVMLTVALVVYAAFSLISSIFVFALGLIPTFTASTGAAVFSAFWLPIILAVFGALIMSGLMLAYYLPLLPLIIFTFGIMGWLVGVFESLIAAPLVAIGIMLPESQGHFMGKAAPAVFLLLNLFLRPTLMLFGLIAGLILANIGTWIFLILFFITIIAMAGSGIQDIYGLIAGQTDAASIANAVISNISNFFYFLVGFVVFGMIISSTVIAIVKKSFALIHTVPDKILQWLSGGFQQQLGSDMSGGADQAGESIRSGMGTAKDTGSKQLQNKNERLQKQRQAKDTDIQNSGDGNLNGGGGRN